MTFWASILLKEPITSVNSTFLPDQYIPIDIPTHFLYSIFLLNFYFYIVEHFKVNNTNIVLQLSINVKFPCKMYISDFYFIVCIDCKCKYL